MADLVPRKGGITREKAMSFILNRVGEGTKVQERDLDIPAREKLAHMVWHTLLTGILDFGDDSAMPAMPIGTDAWIDLMKWVYNRIDGAPAANAPGAEGNPGNVTNVISVFTFDDRLPKPSSAVPAAIEGEFHPSDN